MQKGMCMLCVCVHVLKGVYVVLKDVFSVCLCACIERYVVCECACIEMLCMSVHLLKGVCV